MARISREIFAQEAETRKVWAEGPEDHGREDGEIVDEDIEI